MSASTSQGFSGGSTASLDKIDLNTDQVELKLDTIHADEVSTKTSVDTVKTSVDAVKTSVDAVKTEVDAVKTSTDAVKTSVDGVTTSLGADITTPFAMPAGGTGVRGWLSALWTKLNDSIAVTIASLPLPTGAATEVTLALVDQHIQALKTTHNTNEQFEVTAAPLTLAAGTYNSISVVILSGSADLTVGATTIAALPTGYANSLSADGLLVNEVVITPQGASPRILVSTIK